MRIVYFLKYIYNFSTAVELVKGVKEGRVEEERRINGKKRAKGMRETERSDVRDLRERERDGGRD